MEQVKHLGNETHGNGTPWPALGTINVILARPRGDVRESSGAMSMVGGFDLEARNQTSKRARVIVHPSQSFSKDNN